MHWIRKYLRTNNAQYSLRQLIDFARQRHRPESRPGAGFIAGDVLAEC